MFLRPGKGIAIQHEKKRSAEYQGKTLDNVGKYYRSNRD